MNKKNVADIEELQEVYNAIFGTMEGKAAFSIFLTHW
jgi:hypothetical protein